MRKMSILIILCSGLSLFTYGQTMNAVPLKAAKILPNGWHKFQLQGVLFDVEVIDQVYVKGNIKWSDGSLYSGSLGSKGISGRGTYIWPNGERYEGSSRNNKRHGKGTMYYKNGTKFSGKWRENIQHGKGKLFDVNNEVVQHGTWEMGTFRSKQK